MSPSPIAKLLAGSRTPRVFRDMDHRYLCMFVGSGNTADDGVTPLQRLLISADGGQNLYEAICEVPRGIQLTRSTNAVLVPGLGYQRFMLSSTDGYRRHVILLAIDSEVTLTHCPDSTLPENFHPLPTVVPGRYVLGKGERGYWLAVEILDPNSTTERQWEHFVFPLGIPKGGAPGWSRTSDVEEVSKRSDVPARVKLEGGAVVLLNGEAARSTFEVVFQPLVPAPQHGYSFTLDRAQDGTITAVLRHEPAG